MSRSYNSGRHVCGCYSIDTESRDRMYLPQVKLDAHTTILSTASRTVLRQTFVNASKDKPLSEIRYAFPLFDGVSVVDFVCQVDDRTIYGLVKEKGEARKTYEEAKQRGEKAALMEQLPDAADVFSTSVSNVSANSSLEVTITYVQELKHDAEVDGVRLTIPTSVSPRYGSYPGKLMDSSLVNDAGGISLTVDVSMADGIPIKKVISPSHPVEVSFGSLSTSTIDEDVSMSKASATLALGTTELKKDFILQVVAKDIGIPQVILETHSTLPNQRALMTTLVPKFNLKSQKPEIIFIADRSGSMSDNIPTLVSALKVFLKSIPVGCIFNICSFGQNYEFLWPKSQLYGHDTLNEANSYVDKFSADFGGTETLKAVKACFDVRHKDTPTELMLLTDGEIWSQQAAFDYISTETKKGDARIFSIGIGGVVSSAFIEGVARAGRGFAQMVANNEKLDNKIVRMLKGALTPHINDYRLEVRYEDDSVVTVAESLDIRLKFDDNAGEEQDAATDSNTKPISLYDTDSKEEHPKANEPKDIYAGLPKLDRPKVLQTPHEIPPLFPFIRTTIYLLLAPAASDLKPKSVILRGTSPQGPLELEMPVEVRQKPDEMIHQLAARKATQELEEGRGWVTNAKTDTNVPIKDKFPAQLALLQRREAVRLGVEFQVGGKHCSFVAVEANEAEVAKKRKQALEVTINRDLEGDKDWDMVKPEEHSSAGSSSGTHLQSAIGGVRRIRRTQAARMSTGGKAPQMQLASKAARKSAPVLAPVEVQPQKTSKGVDACAPKKEANNVANQPTAGTLHEDDSEIVRPFVGHPMRRDKHACCGAAEVDDEECEEDEDTWFPCMNNYILPDNSLTMSRHVAPATPPMARSTSSAVSNVEDSALDDKAGGTLLQRLIARQTFEGTWSSIELIPCSEMKLDGDDARTAIQKLVSMEIEAVDKSKAETVLSTAIVIRYLEKRMPDDEDTWQLVVEKAREWLGDAVGLAILAEAWKLAKGIVGE